MELFKKNGLRIINERGKILESELYRTLVKVLNIFLKPFRSSHRRIILQCVEKVASNKLNNAWRP